jgi:pimeloyl-ACP methyl ester carboxylesterase
MRKNNCVLDFAFVSIFIFFFLACGCKKGGDLQDSSVEIRFTEITKAKIAYKIYGSGDPLLMCIGYATNMDLWSTKAIEILQQKYQVIVFDYRGMGYSTNTAVSVTINSLAEDVNELLIALKINKTHVLGWSMGGFVAQKFAINHPEKVDKLVLYATNCGGLTTVNPAENIISILSNPASTPIQMLSTLFPDDWLLTHPEPWKWLPDAKETYNPAAIGLQYVAIQDWLTKDGGSAGQLHLLKMPVLLICGNQDKVAPSINSTILKDSIKSSSLIMVSDSGHGLMYQLPEVFGNYVTTFLAQ